MRTFADAGRDATATLLGVWYAGGGAWRACNAADCATGNSDWGYDSLTYALAGRYAATCDTGDRAGQGQAFARAWILRNAAVARGAFLHLTGYELVP